MGAGSANGATWAGMKTSPLSARHGVQTLQKLFHVVEVGELVFVDGVLADDAVAEEPDAVRRTDAEHGKGVAVQPGQAHALGQCRAFHGFIAGALRQKKLRAQGLGRMRAKEQRRVDLRERARRVWLGQVEVAIRALLQKRAAAGVVGVVMGDDGGLEAQAEFVQYLQRFFAASLSLPESDEPRRLAVAVDAHAAGAVHEKRVFAHLNALVHILSLADVFFSLYTFPVKELHFPAHWCILLKR